MKQDLYPVSGVLLVSLITGLLTGYIFACLFLGLLIYCSLEYSTLVKLLKWMHRKRYTDAPTESGLLGAIAMQYDELRSQHKKHKRRLASYLRQFKEATQALPDAIVVLGSNDEIEWANSKALEYLGIRHPQDQRQRLVNLFRHPALVSFMKETRGKHEMIERSLDLVSPVNQDMNLELRLISYGDSGKLLVGRDTTGIHRVNRMRTDFIANASHELRTPLTVIAGYLESFEDDFAEDDSAGHKSKIRQMRKQAERMRRLIDDLLKLSTLETAETQGRHEPVRVPDLLNSIIEEARTLSGSQKHQFVLEADNSLWLEGDRNQLYSAISNVIFNSVQHTQNHGKITVRWFIDAQEPILEVVDTGEGISAEHIPRITERFYRVDRGRSREKGGTGLGLAIVKHILARHNARLEIESEPGVGSTFRFRFPASLILHKDMIKQRALP